MVRSRVFLAAALLSFAASAHAAGKLTVTLDGKAVTAVPVDRLPDLVIKVDGGAAYSKIYKGVWGDLETALNLSAKAFKKGDTGPATDSVFDWAVTRIEYSGAAKGWGSKTSTTPKTSVVLRQTAFYNYDTTQSVVLAVSYERQVYTGKLIMVDGKLVKETRWETAGPVLAHTVISLEKPTFAAKLDVKGMVAASEAVANAKGARPGPDTFAEAAARHILANTTSAEVKFDFAGSKAKAFKAAGDVTFNWNFDEKGNFDYVSATLPIAFALHGKNSIVTGQFPKPEIVEADFQCTGSNVVATRPIAGSAPFAYKETWINDTMHDGCKTADGKTGADVAATAKGPIDKLKTIVGDKNKTKEQQVEEMMKTMGVPK